MSPHLTVVDGKWQGAREAASALGFDDIFALPTTALRPDGVDAGTAGSAFDFRTRMVLAAATSTGSSAVLDLALVPTAVMFPGASEEDLRVFGDVFEGARRLVEAGGTDEDLDRAAVLLSWCESAYRGGLKSIAEGPFGRRLLDPSYGDDFAARIPDDLLADLAAMRASGHPQLQQWTAALSAGNPFKPNPHFSGRSIVIAVPDWQVGSTLIECKTIEPVTPSKLRNALLQVLGYALLDLDDAHHIREVAVWLPRRGALLTVSLDLLLGGDAEVELPRLRSQFQAEFGERFSQRDWTDDEWVPGTIHPTGGFDEYIGQPYVHEWLRNGVRHREDGPAYISSNYAWWYLDGELIREVQGDGTQLWYQNHSLHREDGPAVIQADRTQLWYRDGRLHRDEGPAVIYRHGEQEWYRDGQLHREDGPAIIGEDGTKEWYRAGELYRAEHGDGTQLWYRNNVLHREDGPAVMRADGTQELWLYGHQYKTEAGWERAKAKLRA